MSSFYKVALLSIISLSIFLSIIFVNCSKDTATLIPTTTSSSTTSSSTISSSTTSTTMLTFGACARTICELPFCAENCESPDKCHVRDVNGICYPSCGYLAVLSEDGKYRGYGPDNQKNTEDDPHTLTKNLFCDELDKWGTTDWKMIPAFNHHTAWEIIEGIGLGCCGSDQQVTRNNQN